MHLIGVVLALHVIASKLILRLRAAEPTEADRDPALPQLAVEVAVTQPATQVELRTFCQQRFGRAPKHVPDAFESKYSDMIDAYYQSDGNLDRFMKIIS